jgi:hypothetical protein
MFIQGTDVFVLIPDDSEERMLHQALILENTDGRIVARFCENIVPAVESTVFLHCEFNRKFMQQAATVQAFLESEPQPLIAFAPFGQAISAENRQCYRVCVAGTNELHATMNGEAEGPLQDISATGFGVVCNESFKIGSVVDVVLRYDGCSYSGKARIQCAKQRSDGLFRYGVHAMEAQRGMAKGALQNGLSSISAAIQRQQLRRLARA